MILSEHGVDSLNPVTFGRSEACARLLLDLRNRRRLPLVFVSGPSGVGKRGLVAISLAQKLGRFQAASNLPVMVSVPVLTRDTSSSIAKNCVGAILEKHPAFRSNKSYGILAKKLSNLAESDPSGVGRRLCALLQSAEQKSSGLSAIRMVLTIEGLDNLFEDRKRCENGADRSRMLSTHRDSLGFLKEMMGTKSVLFCLSYRSWVDDIVQQVVEQSRIESGDILFCELPYADKRTINSVVASQVGAVQFPDTPKPKLKKLAQAIREDLNESPQCLSLLPRMLDSLRDEADTLGKSVCLLDYTGTEGLSGFVCGLAEEVFQMKDVTRQAIWQELFREASKSGDYTIRASEVAKDAELWAMALELTDWRLFSIEGKSLSEAVFLPIHDALFHKWNRACRWMRQEKPSLAAVRQFDEYAIHWEVSNRVPEGLLEDDELLKGASATLKDRDVKHLLSPLTADFLKASLKRRRRELTIYRATIAAGVAAVIGLIALIAGATMYNLSDRGIGIASVLPGDPNHKPSEESRQGEGAASPSKNSPVAPPEPEIGSEVLNSQDPSDQGILLTDAEIEDVILGRTREKEVEVSPLPYSDEIVGVAKPETVVDKTEEVVRNEVANEIRPILDEPVDFVSDEEEAAPLPELSPEPAPVSASSKDAVPEGMLDLARVEVEKVLSSASQMNPTFPSELIELSDAGTASLDPTVRFYGSTEAVSDPLPEPDPEPAPPKEAIPEVAMKIAEPKDEPTVIAKATPPAPIQPQPKSKPATSVTPVAAKLEIEYPEGIDRSSSPDIVVEKFKEAGESGDTNAALNLLVLLHDRLSDTNSPEKWSGSATDLAMSLGKIAMKQGDPKAIEKSWKLGFAGGGASTTNGLSKDLRLLMARVAGNAGRQIEASVFLSKKTSAEPVGENERKIAAAATDWHYGELDQARKTISQLSRNDLSNSQIEGVFIPEELAGETIAGKTGSSPEE